MKAWTVYCGDQADGAVLAFAETCNRARQMGVAAWPGDWAYFDVSAKRAPDWDGMCFFEFVILDNKAIDSEWPRFFH